MLVVGASSTVGVLAAGVGVNSGEVGLEVGIEAAVGFAGVREGSVDVVEGGIVSTKEGWGVLEEHAERNMMTANATKQSII